MIDNVVYRRVDEALARLRVDSLEQQLKTQTQDVKPKDVQTEDSVAPYEPAQVVVYEVPGWSSLVHKWPA